MTVTFIYHFINSIYSEMENTIILGEIKSLDYYLTTTYIR